MGSVENESIWEMIKVEKGLYRQAMMGTWSKVMMWKLITEDTVEEEQGDKTETDRLGNIRTEVKFVNLVALAKVISCSGRNWGQIPG